MPNRKRILIVEDRPNDAEHLARELERFDMQCSCVRSMSEALESTSRRDFDCILLDANLPDSEALETIASTPRFGSTPIVIITGEEDPTLIQMVNEARIGLEFKPINITSLVPKMLQRMNQRAPSVENSEAVLAAHHRIQAEAPTAETPWILRWQPALAFALALVVASMTGGAFLWRFIDAKAAGAQEGIAHFAALDNLTRQHGLEIHDLSVTARELDHKSQTSIEDRAVIHQNLASLTLTHEQRMRELKEDIVARLNRIEDKLDREKK